MARSIRTSVTVPVVVLVCLAAGTGLVAAGAAGPAPDERSTLQATADPHANVTALGTYWRGQALRVSAGADAAGEVFQVRAYDGESYGDLVTEFVLDERGVGVIDTADLPPGRYVIVDGEKRVQRPVDGTLEEAENIEDAWWEVASQELRVTASDQLDNGVVPITVESNRARFTMTVVSPGTSGEQLASVIGERHVVAVRDDSVDVRVSGDTELRLDFSNSSPGLYNFQFNATDAHAGDEIELTVERTDEFAAVDGEFVRSARGDVASIPLELSGTTQATVRAIAEDGDYRAEFTAVDGDGDGRVTVEMNTYRAGRMDNETAVYGAVDSLDEVRNVTRASGRRDAVLAPGDYRIEVWTDGGLTDAASLVLSDNAVRGIEASVAPDVSVLRDVNHVDGVEGVVYDRSAVAVGDAVVFSIDATGLLGLVGPDYDLSPTSGDAEANHVYLEITRRDGTGAERVRFDGGIVRTADSGQFYSVGSGEVYVAIPVDPDTSDFEPGVAYEATFTIEGANPLVSETVTATTGFEVVERRATFDGREGDTVRLERASEYFVDNGSRMEVRLSGSSTVAPGSGLSVIVRSNGSGDAGFADSHSVIVAEDGSWELTMEIPRGLGAATIHVRDGPQTISDRVVAEVVDPASTETEQANDAGSESFEPTFLVPVGAAVALAVAYRYRSRIRGHLERFVSNR